MSRLFDLNWLRTEAANLSDRKAVLLSFALGFVVRLIPEVLSYPHPIGFDTIYYAAMIKRGIVWQHWTSFFSMWLFDAVLIPIHQIAQVDPFVLLKLAAPVLYALNVCGVYYFARKALSWSVKKALTASFFCVFQLALLRMSWDLYRNMLGSAILLFGLPFIQGIENKKSVVLFVLLSALVVFTHILVSVVLFVVVLGVVVTDLMKGAKVRAVSVLLAVLPVLVLFGWSISPFAAQSSAQAGFVSAYKEPTRPGGLFFLVDYLAVSDLVLHYSTYADFALHVLSLFSVLYLWWLPLVFVGFFRDRILDSWTLLLLAGSFGVLITPSCAVDFWNRWMFMLAYPFTFYATNGVQKAFKSKGRSVASGFRWLSWVKVSRRATLGVLSLAIILGSILMVVPPFFDRFGVFFIPTTSSYLPSTMLYNTVPLRDVKSTIWAMEWLNENMTEGAGVLVNHVFLWWTDLYLDENRKIVYFMKDVENALDVALAKGFDPIYFVWWNESFFTWQGEEIGWYGLTITNEFISIFRRDRISVFRYVPIK
jgi:hypothetical protein